MPTDIGDLSGEVMLAFGDLSLAGALGERRSTRIKSGNSSYPDYDPIAIQGTERFAIVVHDVGVNSTAGPWSVWSGTRPSTACGLSSWPARSSSGSCCKGSPPVIGVALRR